MPRAQGVQTGFYEGIAYAVQQGAGGAWGEPTTITTSAATLLGAEYYKPGDLRIAGLNAANQVLVGTAYDSNFDVQVYNFNTNSLTDLGELPAVKAGNYFDLLPFAIDDQGQVLVYADQWSSTLGPVQCTLLLTPGDVAPDPVSAPEPTAWLMWAIAAAGTASPLTRKRLTARFHGRSVG